MAEGRMIKKEIAKSKKIAFLKSEKARSLYFMIYPHVDVTGRISADPFDIKAICIPLFDWDVAVIQDTLVALHDSGLIVLYEVEGQQYLQIERFHDFQRIDKKREADSKIPSPNKDIAKVLERSPEESTISKDKLSKDNKEQQKAEELLKRVHKNGLNIYALLNKLKKQLKWSKEQNFPSEVIIGVCERYFKDAHIKREWPWFTVTIRAESAAYFARKSMEEGEDWKKAPVALSVKAIMKGIG